jgi:hypothetical protein
MTVRMEIDNFQGIRTHDVVINSLDAVPCFTITLWKNVQVPEPYQHGDTPMERMAAQHGVLDRMKNRHLGAFSLINDARGYSLDSAHPNVWRDNNAF